MYVDAITLVITLPDPAATDRLAVAVAPLVRPGDVLLLDGALGTGKTAFARALIPCLTGRPEEVPSPTFTLVQTYETDVATVWHFDLYRLAGPDEVLELGWDDAQAGGIAVVEWPDRLGPLAPADCLTVHFDYWGVDDCGRRATLTGTGSWTPRLARLTADPLGDAP